MTHEVESIMYVGNVPWHGLGTYIGDQPVTSQEAIVAAGLDWEVELAGLTAWGDEDHPTVDVKTHKAVIRSSDLSVLGVVGNRYEPVQNKDAFNFLDSLVANGSMRYHTAGSLYSGKKVWLLGKIGSSEVVPQDKVDQYLLLHTSHDGSSGVRVLFTTVRVVCANTARLALNEGRGNGLYLKHTANILTKVRQAQDILGLAVTQFQEFDTFIARAADLRIDNAKWQEFVQTLIPNPPLPQQTQRLMTVRENTRDILTNLFHSGRGQDLPGVSGTGWAAFNAVTEYMNYHKTSRGENKQERRFDSALFGPGAEMIDRAKDYISQMAA